MATAVLTLGPDLLRQSDELSRWETTLIAFLREAGQSGQTVIMSTEPKLLTPEEAARRLMVSRSTIARRIANGDIQAIKVGNRHRIPYAEVERVWEESMKAMAEVVATDIEDELFSND